MNWFVDTKTLSTVTTAKVSGQLDASDYFHMREQVRQLQVSQAGLNVLLDLRQAVLHIGTLDVFGIASSHNDVFPRGTPYAILISPATMPQGDARFLENVKLNRGAVVKLFTDESAAHEWLQTSVNAHTP